MNMTIRPLRAEERKYTYAQSHQLSILSRYSTRPFALVETSRTV